MQNRCQRVLLTMIVLLCGVGGLAGRALALTFTEFPISTDSRPVGITTGPDGALWFTEPYLDKIGRITTKGTIREFKMPRGSTLPGSLGNITQGPDGALWFNDFTVNKIGRITTRGVIIEFEIPTPGSFPIDITQGPDSALWFTENAANQIGRITTDGAAASAALSRRPLRARARRPCLPLPRRKTLPPSLRPSPRAADHAFSNQ
jgi:virginiamycin B lyase